NPDDKKRLGQLRQQQPAIVVHDEILSQIRELIKTRNPQNAQNPAFLDEAVQAYLNGRPSSELGVWVWYAWENRLVHLLDEAAFIELRTSRNQLKITAAEQMALGAKRIGVVGLSVGQSIALTLAMERGCGELRLADFDTLELSNMNRIRTGVHNLGLPKVVIAAREIALIDPFLRVEIYPEGITAENMSDFFLKNGRLDLVFDECDSLDVKISLRQYARSQRIPVLMDTNDRGMMDVERFDLEPGRPLLHGLAGDLTPEKLRHLGTAEKVPYVQAIIGAETLSQRMKESMPLIGKQLASWPQLASSVALGGALGADVSRRVLLGQFRDSGRYYVDLETLICDKQPENNPVHPEYVPDMSALIPGEAPVCSDKKTADLINIRAFCAPDEPETCRRFLAGHRRRLQEYGIHNLSSLQPEWSNNPDCTVIVAETASGEVVGGVRIEKQRGKGVCLPMAKAVGAQDERLACLIQKEGVAELCGLWVAEAVQGGAIKWALNAYALAAYPLLGVRKLLGFSSPHMLSFLQSLGWQVETGVGRNGVFNYPSPGILSSVVAHNMAKCPLAERQRILAIRQGRHLPFTFSHAGGKKFLLQLECIQVRRYPQHQISAAA
ncbi:MAG: ThiF family adenylyltransferase, partial [Saprospiraceae bacterium]|nr:ThiF family adenylyltransferase [Saprospiraceae bacterium]